MIESRLKSTIDDLTLRLEETVTEKELLQSNVKDIGMLACIYYTNSALSTYGLMKYNHFYSL